MTNKSMFLESLQTAVISLHSKGVAQATYHLTNLISGTKYTLDQEHLFVNGGIYWINYRPETFWQNEKISVVFEKIY